MKRLRWPIFLLLALLNTLSVFPQSANSAAGFPEVSDSRNHKFRLVVESIPNSTTELQASMLKTDGDSSTTQWVTRIPYYRRPFRSPGVYVSDKGDFFIRVSSNDNVTFFRKDPHSFVVRQNSHFGALIYKIDDLFPGVEEVRGVDVLRLWNSQFNRWDAYKTLDASEFRPTPEDIARWNELTRQEVLEKLYAAQREELRRKAAQISAPLARLASRGITNQIGLTQNDYLFLATLRNRDDRKWIEQRLEKDAPTIVRRVQFSRGSSPAREPYRFENVDFVRAEADWLLGFWDKKTSWEERSFAWSIEAYQMADSPRYALGKVTGIIHLPMPMPVYLNATQATALHIRLIPAEKNRDEERITASIGFERARDRRRVYEASFAFTPSFRARTNSKPSGTNVRRTPTRTTPARATTKPL